MKILNVNITLDPVAGGGTAERTFQLSRFLARAGVECSVLTLDAGLTDQRRQDLADVELVALPCWNRRFHLPRSGIGQIEGLAAEADVIHLMGHWNVLNALVQNAAHRWGKPYTVCPAGELPIFGRSRCLKRAFNGLVGRRIVQQAAGWIAITPKETEQFAAYSVAPELVTVIPNGINPDDFRAADAQLFRSQFGLGDRPFVLYMGRLNAIKGPDLLVRAFAAACERFPEHHLVIVGPDGGMLNELQRIGNASGVHDRIHYLGYLGGADKSRAYHAADLLAIPSRQEAMSIVVLEAGISGTPVLITDQCGFNNVAERGGGRVVPATVSGLQSGLTALLHDRAALWPMGQRLKRYVAENFCWDSQVQHYIELSEQLISKDRCREQQHSRHRRVRVCG